MPSRLTQRQYIAIIALVSVAVLILGVVLKPKEAAQATISGEETLRLQTLTQRRNLENLAVYFSEVAGGIQPGLVWLNEIGMTGLVWNQDGLIVTASPRQWAPAEIAALTSSGSITLDAQVLSADFRVASLKAPRDAQLQPVRKGSTAGITPGIWIIQIARQAGGNYLFTPGVYGGVASTKCGATEYRTLQSNLPLAESALGGGLFDVDGNLLAMVVRCDDHFAAVMPTDIDREIARATSFDGRLLTSYGFRVTALDDVFRKYFQVNEGVMVSEVMDGRAADAASLAPGDLITALNKAPVRVPDDLRRLLISGQSPENQPPEERPVFQLEVHRNRRVVQMNLKPSEPRTTGERPGAESSGIGLADSPQGYLVGTVAGGSRAERASIQAGDRLLFVDGRRPPNAAAVRRLLSDQVKDPIFVVFRRGSRRMGTFLN